MSSFTTCLGVMPASSRARGAATSVALGPDDVYRLTDECGQHRTLVLVLAYCGVRWGEPVALRVRDVEFLRRRLSVSENAVQLSVNHAVGPTKGWLCRPG